MPNTTPFYVRSANFYTLSASSPRPAPPLAVRGSHGARVCERPGRHPGRGRRLGLRRDLAPSGRGPREVTPPPLTSPRNHCAVSAQTLLARRPDSTAGETRDAADLTSAGHALPEHAEEPEKDERTQSRRTVGELVQFVRGSACPGFTPESICPSLEPTNLNPLSNSDRVAQNVCTVSALPNWLPLAGPNLLTRPAHRLTLCLPCPHLPTCALLCASTSWLRASARVCEHAARAAAMGTRSACRA